MAILGLPDENFISEMTGFVTHEDREAWEQKKAASDAELERARGSLSARGLASKAATPAMNFAQQVITAQMHAEQTEERRDSHRKQSKQTSATKTFQTTEPVSFDERGPEF